MKIFFKWIWRSLTFQGDDNDKFDGIILWIGIIVMMFILIVLQSL